MSGVQGTVEQLTIALGTAVLHSLWQCALIGTVAAVLMLVVRRANTRYIVWCVSLLLCAVWMGLTFVDVMWPGGSGGGAADELGFGRVLPMMMPSVAPASSTIMLEVIAWLWVGGFVYCTIRYAQQWGAARRLRTRDLVEVEHRWSDLFEEVRAGLGVSRRVGMLVSTRAPSPMVVGWLSPVVIVPLSALTMLSPEQVRLVLVHELAHIRRYDHVVNMLQVLIETALFYHPVVWWMSHQARLEREHCCDDAAVRWGGDAVAFARALTELETTRTGSRAVLALNPMNHGGSLMNRITRILGSSESHRLGNGSLRMLVALSAGTLVAVAGIANAALRTHEPRGAQIEVVRANVESGVMTQAQARRIFDEIIYPGSDMQMKMDAELDRVGMEIERAVQSGRITAEQGRMKLDAVRDGMDERREYHFRMSVLGMTKSDARLSVLGESLAAQVAAGTLSQQEADVKYNAVEREIGMESRVQEHLEKLGQEIRLAIELGELTPQEGRARMQEARRGIEAKIWWASIERRIEAAVESGSMTREDADTRYAELRATLDAKQQPMTVKVESVGEAEETEAGKVIKLDVVVPAAEMKKAEGAGEHLELEIIVEPAGAREDAGQSSDSSKSGVQLTVEPVLKSQDAADPAAIVEQVWAEILGEGEVPGMLDAEKLHLFLMDEIATIEQAVEAGTITKEEGAAQRSAFLDDLEFRLWMNWYTEVMGMTEEESKLAVMQQLQKKTGSVDVEVVPVLEDVPLILEGVDAGALESRLKQEQGAFEYYKRNQVAKVEASVRAEVESGRITKQEAQARIDDELRRQRFVARWLSIHLMYQDQVSAGRMTVDEANRLLERALKENGYAASEFAQADPMLGMQVVAADHVFEVMVTPDGKPVGAELEVEMKAVEPKPETRKLTPMDDAYFYHQGIRALSEYEEENPDDC